MDILIEIYNKLRKLRDCGVKMKDIAEQTEIASSVLSSLYSTVLPSYTSAVSEGVDKDQALDDALTMVNNISKKRLLATAETLYNNILAIDPRVNSSFSSERPFFDDIENLAAKCISNIPNYSGTFWGYSKSSYKDGLKVEPYMICGVQEGELMPKVHSCNAAGQVYSGVGMFSAHQIGYLFFNEQKRLQIGLKVIYLQLPMFDNPTMIRGIYLAHDYNRNPIARRILLVKQSDQTDTGAFADMPNRIIPVEELSPLEKQYYDYTCGSGDHIRSFMVASPEADLNELIIEKKILDVIQSSI